MVLMITIILAIIVVILIVVTVVAAHMELGEGQEGGGFPFVYYCVFYGFIYLLNEE